MVTWSFTLCYFVRISGKYYYLFHSNVYIPIKIIFLILKPFYGNDNKETFKYIINGQYTFHNEYWQDVSSDAQE